MRELGNDFYLMRTRLRPPSRGGGLVDRKRLAAPFERRRSRRVVFVKAPAGYGKSSLLHHWFDRAAASNDIVGWLSVDAVYDDLRAFFFHVAAAIREHHPGFGDLFMEFLKSASEPSVHRMSAAFLNELIDIDDHVVLFIDDFHLIRDTEILDAICAVLTDAPPNLHMVVASRQAFPMSLARLRMMGQVEEVDAETLRFDAEELQQFFTLAGHDSLTDQECHGILDQTEGWAAGIQLTAISRAQSGSAPTPPQRESSGNRAISEYLLDDVINSLAPETVEFLLKTSILNSFCPDLATALTGGKGARAEIDGLEKQSLFIFSLDSERQWYRYHHLFAELLQRMLQEQLPDIVSDLHIKASDWYAAHGNTEAAFNHALAAGDEYRAAAVLETTCTKFFYAGRSSSLIRWSSQISHKVLQEFPRLQLEIAWSIIIRWKFDEARDMIANVEARVRMMRDEGGDPETIEALSHIALHRKMMLSLFMDDMPPVESVVLELLHDFPSDEPYLRGSVESALIAARRELYRFENIDKMDRWAREFFARSGSRFVLVWHQSILGPTYHARGDTALAEEVLTDAMEIAEYVDGPQTPLQAMPALLLAEIRYEQNDLATAAALLDRFEFLANEQGFVDQLAAYHVTRARLLFRDGKVDEARRCLDDGMSRAAFLGFSRLTARIEHELLRQTERMGDFGLARDIVARAERPEHRKRLTPGSHTTSADETFVLTWRLAQHRVGAPRDAIDVLKRWVTYADNRGILRTKVRMLIALAQSLMAIGEEGEALRRMRAAVQSGAHAGLVRSFVDEGVPVLNILKRLFSNEEEPTGAVSVFASDILAAFAAEPGMTEALDATRDAPAPGGENCLPPESLSEREHDVLRLVSWGMSNKEIAAKLGFTEGTVKWYMQQIFLKLDVRRRSLAVRRAKQFGIL